MEKYYRIYGTGNYVFDGNDSMNIKVTKETKDRIYGISYSFVAEFDKETKKHYSVKVPGSKVVIIKRNIQGWKEL